MKKPVRIFVYVLISGLLLGTLLFSFPQILINSHSIAFTRTLIAKNISWKTLEVKARSESFLTKSLKLDLRQLCFDPENIEGCLNINLDLDLQFFKTKLLLIHRFYIFSEALNIKEQKKVKPVDSEALSMPRIERFDIEAYDWLELKDLSIEIKELQLAGIFPERLLHLRSSGYKRDAQTKLQLNLESQKKDIILQLLIANQDRALKLDCKLKYLNKDIIFNSLLEIPVEPKKNALLTSDWELFYKDQNSNELEIAGEAEVFSKDLSLKLMGKLKSSEYGRIDLESCGMSWALKKHLNSDIRLKCSLIKQIVSKEFKRKLPDQLIFKLDWRVATKDKGERIKSNAFVELEETMHRNILLSGHFKLNYSGSLDKAFDLRNHDGSYHFELKTQNIRLFDFLATEFGALIPAPMDKLSGPSILLLSGEFPKAESKLIKGKYKLDLDLKSDNQWFKTLGEGRFSFQDGSPPKLYFFSDLLFKKTKLVAPPIELRPPPQLLPDTRFKTSKEEEEEKEEKPSPKLILDYQVNAKTAANSPFFIKTNRTTHDIPLEFDLKHTPELTSGWIRINEVQLDLFRRDAKLYHLSLELKPKVEKSPIDGKFGVFYADYTVWIELAGTVGQPVLHLRSEPPLPQNDIYSVLLFGYPLNEGGFEEGESVNGMQSAISDGALSLFSLYYLSSTGIERIRYNPESKTVNAKVRLPGGFSTNLGIGSSQLKSVAFRKRLGGGFFIETTFDSLFNETDNQSITTFLEWINRY